MIAVAEVVLPAPMSDASATSIAVQTDLAISVRRALPDDATSVAALVNRAYAVESFFVDGDRTSPAEILSMIEQGNFIVLEHSGGLAAAVYLDLDHGPGRAYLGMLSVDPAFQGEGLGTRLVRIVEALSEASGCREVTLRIINLREELPRWYRSLGFEECGTSPYEHRPLKQPCHFIEMRKVLRPAADLGAPAAAVAI
jgi:ribosomal protein S18 acetylase RimI-like enzyme